MDGFLARLLVAADCLSIHRCRCGLVAICLIPDHRTTHSRCSLVIEVLGEADCLDESRLKSPRALIEKDPIDLDDGLVAVSQPRSRVSSEKSLSDDSMSSKQIEGLTW